MHRPLATLAATAALAGAGAIAYSRLIRPWHQHWGATAAEVGRPMPGDDYVVDPLEVTTRAVTVNAPPAAIWPWLVQMGNGRGGLYSYDWIDLFIGALDRPSVDVVLPEYQQPRAGEIMPYAKGADMVMRAVEPERALLLTLDLDGGRTRVSQSWALDPIDATRTRLVLRVRAATPVTARGLPALLMLDPAEFVMVRRQLLGIKQRAERLAREDHRHAGG
jgi:hypothetical protein